MGGSDEWTYLGNNEVESNNLIVIPARVFDRGVMDEDLDVHWGYEERETGILHIISNQSLTDYFVESGIKGESIGPSTKIGDKDNVRRTSIPIRFFDDSVRMKPVQEPAQMEYKELRHFVTKPGQEAHGVVYVLSDSQLMAAVSSPKNWAESEENREALLETAEARELPRDLIPEDSGVEIEEPRSGLSRRTTIGLVVAVAAGVLGTVSWLFGDSRQSRSTPANEADSEILATDFEDGRLTGWAPIEMPENGEDRDGNHWKVTEEGHISGQYSARLVSAGQWDDNCLATDEFVIDMAKDLSISFKWWTPDQNNAGPVVTLLKKKGVDFEDRSTEEVRPMNGIWLRLGPDAINEQGLPYNGVGSFCGNKFDQPSLETRTVHEIRIVKKGSTAELYINDDELASGDVRTSGSYRLVIGGEATYGNPSVIFFDDILVAPSA